MHEIDFTGEAEGLRSQLIARRRDLHQHPELRFAVHRTAGIVAQTLGELGYEVRTGVGQTGRRGASARRPARPTVMSRGHGCAAHPGDQRRALMIPGAG